MIIDTAFIKDLLAKAEQTPRKRAYYDLRNCEEEASQRVLIAMLPGSASPIHRHPETSETIVVLQGEATELLYDAEGNECGRNTLCPERGNFATLIPAGQWHTIIADQPCVVLESKAGCYRPVNPENVLSYTNRRFEAKMTVEALQKELELAVQTNDIFALKMLVPKIAVSDVLAHPELEPVYRQALSKLN
ncbi:MAG: WbuC family cupin fold metalloprotein [Paludibacteraceae bacterium]|nr:WbuC family cupin fold metalloprotein [Paludibacteraceae bacterium]